ncbi:MAG: hypothetical protein K2K80_04250 [Clostridia bacterium]|nr:hypothetical protein [Clostridia bacterium]
MSEDTKHCYNCCYYKPYYLKGDKQFDRCDIGFCSKKKATVEKREVFDKFYHTYYAHVSRRQTALTALVEHINILSEIKQILDEDDDEMIKELFLDFKKRKR